MVSMSKEQAAKSLAMLKQAKKLPNVEKTEHANGWHVRPGTVAVCRALIGGNVQEGVTFHVLLEPWVETKKKLSRKVDGVMLPCLWFSGENLAPELGRETVKRVQSLPGQLPIPPLANLKRILEEESVEVSSSNFGRDYLEDALRVAERANLTDTVSMISYIITRTQPGT